MSEKLETRYDDELFTGGPQSALERRLIIEYLHDRGYQLQHLKTLPMRETQQLMIEACRYASLKLAEVEARAHLKEEIGGSFSS